MNTPIESRPSAASHSVVNALILGTPAATVLGYLQAVISAKYKIPSEVVGAAFGLLIAGSMSAIQYFSHGGRKGESS